LPATCSASVRLRFLRIWIVPSWSRASDETKCAARRSTTGRIVAKQFETTLSHDCRPLLGPSSVADLSLVCGGATDLVVEVDVVQFERAIDGQAHCRRDGRLRKASGKCCEPLKRSSPVPRGGPGLDGGSAQRATWTIRPRGRERVRALPAAMKKGTFRFSPTAEATRFKARGRPLDRRHTARYSRAMPRTAARLRGGTLLPRLESGNARAQVFHYPSDYLEFIRSLERACE